MLVGCALHFFLKIFFFNKWSPNSYLFWMMEGFYIQKKMGDTKKQIIFEKCHHWWGGFQDDEKVKTLLAEQHLNLSDLQRGILFLFFVKSISRNFSWKWFHENRIVVVMVMADNKNKGKNYVLGRIGLQYYCIVMLCSCGIPFKKIQDFFSLLNFKSCKWLGVVVVVMIIEVMIFKISFFFSLFTNFY